MRSYASLSPEAEFRKRFGSYGFTRASVDVVVSNMSIVVSKVTTRCCVDLTSGSMDGKRIVVEVSLLLIRSPAIPVSASTVITVSGGDKVIP